MDGERQYKEELELGGKLVEAGRPEDALLIYNLILDISSNHFFVLGSKVIALHALGKYSDALICEKKIRRIAAAWRGSGTPFLC